MPILIDKQEQSGYFQDKGGKVFDFGKKGSRMSVCETYGYSIDKRKSDTCQKQKTVKKKN